MSIREVMLLLLNRTVVQCCDFQTHQHETKRKKKSIYSGGWLSFCFENLLRTNLLHCISINPDLALN